MEAALKFQEVREESLFQIDIKNQQLAGSIIDHCNYENVNFTEAIFFASTFQYVTFKDCHFTGCSFIFTHFKNCIFDNCTFESIDWSGSSIRSCSFNNCEMDHRLSSLAELHQNQISYGFSELQVSLFDLKAA